MIFFLPKCVKINLNSVCDLVHGLAPLLSGQSMSTYHGENVASKSICRAKQNHGFHSIYNDSELSQKIYVLLLDQKPLSIIFQHQVNKHSISQFHTAS